MRAAAVRVPAPAADRAKFAVVQIAAGMVWTTLHRAGVRVLRAHFMRGHLLRLRERCKGLLAVIAGGVQLPADMKLHTGAHGRDTGQVAQHDIPAGIIPCPVGELSENGRLILAVSRLRLVQIDPVVSVPALQLHIDVAVGICVPAPVAVAVVGQEALLSLADVRRIEVNAVFRHVPAADDVAADGKLIGTAGREPVHLHRDADPFAVLAFQFVDVRPVPLSVEAHTDCRVSVALFVRATAVRVSALAADRAKIAVVSTLAGRRAKRMVQHAAGVLAAAAGITQFTGMIILRGEKRNILAVSLQLCAEIHMDHHTTVRIPLQRVRPSPDVSGIIGIGTVAVFADCMGTVCFVAGIDIVMDALPCAAVPAGNVEIGLFVRKTGPVIIHPDLFGEERIAPCGIGKIQAGLLRLCLAVGHIGGDTHIVCIVFLQDALVDGNSHPGFPAAAEILRGAPDSVDPQRDGRRGLCARGAGQNARQRRNQKRQRKQQGKDPFLHVDISPFLQ